MKTIDHIQKRISRIAQKQIKFELNKRGLCYNDETMFSRKNRYPQWV